MRRERAIGPSAAPNGYDPMSREEASLFFRLVSYRYGRGAMIITTNKSIRDWTELLAGDEVLATAILDRLPLRDTPMSSTSRGAATGCATSRTRSRADPSRQRQAAYSPGECEDFVMAGCSDRPDTRVKRRGKIEDRPFLLCHQPRF